ncbi:MAG: VCBS repeat-containing protein [Sandaracinaceae bacterium]
MRTYRTAWIAALLALAAPASADWPMHRQNPSRTATAPGSSELGTPAIRWRTYLGGSVGVRELAATDVDGDGQVEILYVSGGRIVAKRPDDRLVWETRPLTLRAIHAIRDMDGDGILDVVASGTPGRIAIFRGTDGALEWRTAPGTIGPSIGAVRLADLNGDSRLDLYVADAACGSTDSLLDVAFAFSFGGGYGSGIDDGSQRLWQLERGRRYVCGVNDVVLDVDGDGDLEIIAWASNEMYLFDAATGAKIDSGDAAFQGGFPTGFSIPYGTNRTWVTDVDGDGAMEVVGYTNNSYTPSINSRAVFVVGWDDARPAGTQLHVRWVTQVSDITADTHTWVDESAMDLDGDGIVEVTSTFTEGGVATTHVRDGRDGTVRASIPGELQGIVQLSEAGPPTLLVQDGLDLNGYRFSDFSAVPPPAFTLPASSLLDRFDRGAYAQQSLANVPLTVPLPGSTRGLVVLEGDTLKLWDLSGSTPVMAGSYALPPNVTAVAVASQVDASRPGPGALLVRSDGFLVVLDRTLAAINFGGAEIPLPGIRTGGYYSGDHGLGPVPVAASFGRAAEEVVVLDSRGGLIRLATADATITQPPEQVFRWQGVRFPLLTDVDGDGITDVVAVDDTRMHAREADGTSVLFTTPVAMGQQNTHGDVVPIGSGASRRFVTGIFDRGDGNGSLAAVSVAGASSWRTTPVRVAGSGFGYPTVDDVQGDGGDDLLVNMASPLRAIDGADGTILGTTRGGHSNMPINVRGRAGSTTTLWAGSHTPPGGITIAQPFSGSSDVWELDYRATRHFGAVVECPDGLQLAISRFGSAQLTVARAEDGANRRDVYAADGNLFLSAEAAAASGAIAGLLGNATATQDLGGGQPAVLFGSTDGYLYAIDPCSEPLRKIWSLSFRAPVGEAIFADTDGDGLEELVVSAADGFLYGVDTEALPAPETVLDTDPGLGLTTEDVDETRGAALGARWDAVPEAESYEYAVFTIGGSPVTRNPMDETNPFIPTTSTSVEHRLGLEAGTTYFFAVRAIGAEGTSSEALSDGTLYAYDPSSVDGGVTLDAGAPVDASGGGDASVGRDGGGGSGGEGGCGCRAAGTGRAPLWALLALGAFAWWRRRSA